MDRKWTDKIRRRRCEPTAHFRDGKITLAAQFWRTPLAVASLSVVIAQIILIDVTHLLGQPLPIHALHGLMLVACALAVAGITPDWNRLSYNQRGIEQLGGLRTVRIAWDDVKDITPRQDGVELHLKRPIRGLGNRVVIENRYGMAWTRFADMLSHSWMRAQPAAA